MIGRIWATAATNTLSHQADLAKVQEWLGHANVSTTRRYDQLKTARRSCGQACTRRAWALTVSCGSTPVFC